MVVPEITRAIVKVLEDIVPLEDTYCAIERTPTMPLLEC